MGFLRQINASLVGLPPQVYSLPKTQEIALGREPSCDIILDSQLYGMVSRRHVLLRPQFNNQWEICDLNSANGTFINGQKLQGCQMLQERDRVTLGVNGPEFIFELTNQSAVNVPIPSSNSTPTNSPVQSEADSVTLTQLFPIASTGKQLRQKAYLYPGFATVIFVVSMFIAVGNPLAFNMLIATYLAGAAYYFVYRLCGKYKPWWVLFLSGIITIIILISPLLNLFLFIFRDILPGRLPSSGENVNFFVLFIKMFFGAGLMEELIKSLPVFAALIIGVKVKNTYWKYQVGVGEPLDGILLGTASAVGFTLLETLGQYVPNITHSMTLQGGQNLGFLVGLQLLIPRILGSVAGHIAYSGYFGYFIGLSVLKSKKKWQILTVGYLSASFLHALWNTSGTVSVFLLALVGALSYAFLTAAILKARTLSPTRSKNFATHIFH